MAIIELNFLIYTGLHYTFIKSWNNVVIEKKLNNNYY